MYATKGIWRPSQHSMMKTLGYYFDQVSREHMTRSISAKVSLIQDSTPTTTPIGADRVVWVEPMHPNSHELTTTWSVDGTGARRATASELDLRHAEPQGGQAHGDGDRRRPDRVRPGPGDPRSAA